MTQKPIGMGDCSLPTAAKSGERYVLRLEPAGRHMSQEYRDHEGCVVTVKFDGYLNQPVMVRADDGWVGHAYDDELFPVTGNAGGQAPAAEAVTPDQARLALQACRALELAYARGEVSGSVDWSDLDEARALAQKALGPQECAVIDEFAQKEAAA